MIMLRFMSIIKEEPNDSPYSENEIWERDELPTIIIHSFISDRNI
jgi:hypothetical protein